MQYHNRKHPITIHNEDIFSFLFKSSIFSFLSERQLSGHTENLDLEVLDLDPDQTWLFILQAQDNNPKAIRLIYVYIF